MTLILDLTLEEQNRIVEARRRGIDVEALLHGVLSGLPEPQHQAIAGRTYTARELLKLSKQERDQYLRVAAEQAAPMYEADLALPAAQRELTAFSTLSGADFMEEAKEAK